MTQERTDFFGRREHIDYLRRWSVSLKEGYRQNVCIIGEETCGKTSLLQQFLRESDREKIVFIYIDSARIDVKTFTVKFLGGLLCSLMKVHSCGAAHEVPVTELDVERLLVSLEPHLPHTAQAIRGITKKTCRAEETLSTVLDLPACVYKESNIPVVLVFDEFHALANLHHNFFKMLSKKMMFQKHSMFILTSSRVSLAKEILRNKFDLLFGNFHTIEIGNFDFFTAKQFVSAALPHTAFESHLDNFLLSITGGNPFYLKALTDKLKESQNRFQLVLTSRDFVRALTQCMFDAQGALNHYFQHFIEHFSRDARWAVIEQVLSALAHGDLKLQGLMKGKKRHGNLIAKTLAHLVKEGVILKYGACYDFVDLTFKFWYGNVYTIQKESLIAHPGDQETRFGNALNAVMEKFCGESLKDAHRRTLELFKDFAPSLIQLRGRAYRLPHFTKVTLRDIGRLRSCILAQNNTRYWLGIVRQDSITEDDIHSLSEELKKYRHKFSKKLLITLKEIDKEALTIAKENDFVIVDLNDLNMLLRLSGKEIFIP
jgi:AAA+ ATPase superfamily predicted ATPase